MSSYLYSTASYQAGQLSGISLWYLPGVILSGLDLTYASFIGDFAGADFSQSNLAYSSCQTPYGGTLASADFSNTNLTGARIQADVTGANFSGAEVRGTTLHIELDSQRPNSIQPPATRARI